MKNKINKTIITALIAAQTLSFSNISYGAPSKVLGRDKIMKWDYHRTYYDENGKVKIKPTTSLFDTENENKKIEDLSLPRVFIEDTKYGNDIHIKVDSKHENYENWTQNIYKITKLSESFEDNPNLELPVEYSLKNGEIILNKESTALSNNGLHQVKIYSKNFSNKIIPVHIVKKGSIILTGESFAHNDVMFKLEDFNYGITNPVYEILLDGQSLKGDCDEYHIISSLIRLEKNILPKLTVGKHRLVVRAIGYEDFVKDFYLDPLDIKSAVIESSHQDNLESYPVDDNLIDLLNSKQAINSTFKSKSPDVLSSPTKKPGKANETTVDSVSSATGGGSLVQNVDLVFDFDLVSNALILERLNKSTDYSKRVTDRWYSAIIDYVQEENNDEVLYTWDHYKDAVNKHKLDNKYLSFEDYIKGDSPKTTKNRGYSYKFVLEDGLLGEVQRYDQIIALDILIEEAQKHRLGDDIELLVNNKEFLNNLERVFVGSTQISDKYYKLIDNKIIISSPSNFSLGKNKIRFISKGFMDSSIDIELYKELPSAKLEATKDGLLITDLNEDFIKGLKGISINNKSLFNKLQVGSGEDYRLLDKDILIYPTLFKENGIYNISITSRAYETLNLKYTKTEETNIENPDIDSKPLDLEDGFKIDDKQNPSSNGGAILINDNFTQERFDSIKEISINDIVYPLDKISLSKNPLFSNKASLIFEDLSFFNKKDTSIIIKYKDFNPTIFTAYGKDVIDEPEKKKDGFIIKDNQSAEANGGAINIAGNYSEITLDDIVEVTVNGSVYPKDKLRLSKHFYDSNLGTIYFSSLELFNSEANEVVIKYTDFSDTSFIVKGRAKIDVDKDEDKELPNGLIVKGGVSISSNSGNIIINENFDKELLSDIKSITVNGENLILNEDITITRSFFMGGDIKFHNYSRFFTKESNEVIIKYNNHRDTVFTLKK